MALPEYEVAEESPQVGCLRSSAESLPLSVVLLDGLTLSPPEVASNLGRESVLPSLVSIPVSVGVSVSLSDLSVGVSVSVVVVSEVSFSESLLNCDIVCARFSTMFNPFGSLLVKFISSSSNSAIRKAAVRRRSPSVRSKSGSFQTDPKNHFFEIFVEFGFLRSDFVNPIFSANVGQEWPTPFEKA